MIGLILAGLAKPCCGIINGLTNYLFLDQVLASANPATNTPMAAPKKAALGWLAIGAKCQMITAMAMLNQPQTTFWTALKGFPKAVWCVLPRVPLTNCGNP